MATLIYNYDANTGRDAPSSFARAGEHPQAAGGALGAANLALLMRKSFGNGTPRGASKDVIVRFFQLRALSAALFLP
jgi:hypothetical protein